MTRGGGPHLVFLWATPRSVSTAFAKSLSQLPQTVLEHEPYTDVYYFGPERQSGRYDGSSRRTEDCSASVSRMLLSRIPSSGTLLVKELAFQGRPYLDPELAARGVHIAITRHPSQVYRSLVKLKPDFTMDEFGFGLLHALLCELRERRCDVRTVVDGDDLRDNPAGVVARVCEQIGLPFSSSILRWDDGRIRDWSDHELMSQAVWHRELEKSHGFIAPATVDLSDPEFRLPEHEGVFREAVELYEDLLRDPSGSP